MRTGQKRAYEIKSAAQSHSLPSPCPDQGRPGALRSEVSSRWPEKRGDPGSLSTAASLHPHSHGDPTGPGGTQPVCLEHPLAAPHARFSLQACSGSFLLTNTFSPILAEVKLPTPHPSHVQAFHLSIPYFVSTPADVARPKTKSASAQRPAPGILNTQAPAGRAPPGSTFKSGQRPVNFLAHHHRTPQPHFRRGRQGKQNY